ncbi:hypothetical protein ABKN59_010902 [Abortiporus biennis]
MQDAQAEWEEFFKVNPPYCVPTSPQLSAMRLGVNDALVDPTWRPVSSSIPLFPPVARWSNTPSGTPAELPYPNTASLGLPNTNTTSLPSAT